MTVYENLIINNTLGVNTWKVDPTRPIVHDDILTLPIQHTVSYRVDGTRGFLFVSCKKMWIWYPRIPTPIVIIYDDPHIQNENDNNITVLKITFKNRFIFISDILTLNGKVVSNSSCITERMELVRQWLQNHGSAYMDPIKVTKWKTKYHDSFLHITQTNWTLIPISLYHPIHTRYLWAQKSVVDTPFDVTGMEFKQILTPYRQYTGIVWTESDQSLVRLYISNDKKPHCLKYGRKREVGELYVQEDHSNPIEDTIQYCFYRSGKWIISHACASNVIQPDPISIVEVGTQHVNIRCFGKFQ